MRLPSPRLPRPLLLVLALAASPACARTAPPPAVVTLDLPSLPVAPRPPDPAPRGTCRATLRVGKLELGEPTCFVDAKIRDRPGDLSYTCAGGPAEARFPGAVFAGHVAGGHLDVSLSTEFDWEDGCKWRSEQHIRGALAGGALEYTYTEAPLPGQEGCTTTCAAHARVVLRPDGDP